MTDIVERLTRAADLLETGQYDIINTSLVKEAAAEIKRLRAALTMALEYEPVRSEFQTSSKGDLQFAESQKVWAAMRSVLPSPPTQEGGG